MKLSEFAGRSESLALAVKASNAPSLIVRLVIGASEGAAFTSLTITVTLPVALRLGTPLSVTRTVKTFVLGPVRSLVGHVMRPVVALMDAPAGAPGNRANVSVFAGKSGSVAVFVMSTVVPSFTVCAGLTISR